MNQDLVEIVGFIFTGADTFVRRTQINDNYLQFLTTFNNNSLLFEIYFINMEKFESKW